MPRLLDPRLALIVALALLAGIFAYQAQANAAIPVGWLGDRLFLAASEGAGAADRLTFYGDELTPDARSGRSRWTHQGARVDLIGLGGDALEVTIRARGWPTDVLNRETDQPTVTVTADNTIIGSFTPNAAWDDFRLTIPAEARQGPNLTLTLQSSHVFTSTATYADPRPKGIRVEAIVLNGSASGPAFPAIIPILWLTLGGITWYLTLSVFARRPTPAFVATTVLVTIAAVALAAARVWTVVLLPWFALVGALPVIWKYRAALTRYPLHLARRFGRGMALGYGILAATTIWLIAGLALNAPPLPEADSFWQYFPDSLIYSMIAIGILLLVLVYGRNGLPRLTEQLIAALSAQSYALTLLALFLVTWLGYLLTVVMTLPYVGHADYADNAVVARNLLAGRGWTVDYVTQFYRLYDGVTRPQETWPLLQPLWVALSFALFGVSNWAAKLPNIVFSLALALAVYAAGARLWNRRVGLVAAIVLLTNHLYFKLAIYVTNDLAFTLFAFGALALLYQAVAGADQADSRVTRRTLLIILGSGVLTGLMLLQKPGSGGLIALGMGLWFLAARVRRFPTSISAIRAQLAPVVVWGAIAFIILTPYLARNLLTFGAPYYSTESKDAWVLEYTEWDQIYAVYTTEDGLSELGPPDRSWILRWGFDRTLVKIERQVRAMRDYLLPAWNRLPFGIGEYWLGRADKDRLLFEAGAWLSLFGAIGAFWTRRRLMQLLGAAFLPYSIFLIFYWHTNEERYWVVLMPWLALFAAATLWSLYERVAALSNGRWAPIGLVLLVALGTAMVRPSWPDIAEKVRDEPQLYGADLDMYAWLKQNTPPDSVMMTRSPWQLNWHSERPALMIPYTTDQQIFFRLARHYQVRYLVLDTLQRPEPEVQRMLDAMVADPALGFREVYRTPVYRADFRGVTKELVAVVYAFPEQ